MCHPDLRYDLMGVEGLEKMVPLWWARKRAEEEGERKREREREKM